MTNVRRTCLALLVLSVLALAAIASAAPALASSGFELTSAQQSFSPSIEVTPETSATDTPTGLEINLRVPQNEDPNGPAEAHVKDAVVTLPPGLTLVAFDNEWPRSVLARADRDRLGPGNGTPAGVPGRVEGRIPGSDHAAV